jgi:hypothetical protein
MQKITKVKNQKGSTIVELLLYMGLMAVLLIVLSDMFISILDVKTDIQKTSSIEQDGRFIIARFIYDIQRATSITTPSSAGGNGATLVMVVAGNTYTYSLNGTNLQMVNNTGTFNLNGDETKVTDLNFKRIGNGQKDTITVQFDITSQTQTTTFKTTVGLR